MGKKEDIQLLMLKRHEGVDKMEGRLLLNVIIRKSATVLKPLASKGKALLVQGNKCLLDLESWLSRS